MREKLACTFRNLDDGGITPACAGKTKILTAHTLTTQDHPRVCGKNVYRLIIPQLATGSPPRVREKLLVRLRIKVNGGITPACAGKTNSDNVSLSFGGDHPRVCGKNISTDWKFYDIEGSSPRVREKPERTGITDTSNRITPACAGKTHKTKLRSLWPRDHPRECGKNVADNFHLFDCLGSPPRVREKRQYQDIFFLFHGITPASAGKTTISKRDCKL